MGVYTTRELRAKGIGQKKLRSMVEQGRLIRIYRGIYVDEVTPQAVATAVTRCFGPAALTRKSAAELYLGKELTFPIEAEGARKLSHKLFNMTRSRLPAKTQVKGLPVVEPLWAARSAPDDATHILEAQYRGKKGVTRFARDFGLMKKIPAWLRRAIKRTPIGAASGLETSVAKPLLERGYQVLLNHFVGPYCFDIQLPQWRIAIEVDSEMHHLNESSFISDRWKGNSGAVHGWTVLRFTDTCVRWELNTVIEQVEQAIEWVKRRRPIRGLKLGFPAGSKVWDWNETVR